MATNTARNTEPLSTIVEEYLKYWSHCKIHKPTTEYHNNRSHKDACKLCIKVYLMYRNSINKF